jgi:methanogenic corrinoid protein MtbC1
MTRLIDLADSIIQGDHTRAAELTRAAITDGMAPKAILDDGLIAGMTVVGDRSGSTRSSCPTCCSPPGPCMPAWTCSSRS